jgi:phosphoribosyl 1,2-cyclic phosphodiesterase
VKVTIWGSRGSIPAPGPETMRYGGNTSCVQVTLSDGTLLVLDAGTGIRALGLTLARAPQQGPVNILLTHLHLDHIQGLMFFVPLFSPGCHVRIGGPPSLNGPLLKRLSRYISAPLAPVEIRELPSEAEFEEVPIGSSWSVGPARVEAAFVNHRGPTVAYRVTDGDATVAYIPDHEPALGQRIDTSDAEWISGFGIARDAALLIHDCQYTDGEYGDHLGWGHCAVGDAITFAKRSGARRLALFHHDPLHDDDALDTVGDEARALAGDHFEDVSLAREGELLELPT